MMGKIDQVVSEKEWETLHQKIKLYQKHIKDFKKETDKLLK
jgi:hypothetical protein